jgi:hypothetical protein
MTVVYRFKQLAAALRADVSSHERDLVSTLLNSQQQALFERMPLFDQRHCLDVYHTLQQAGYNKEHILQAALLHDCGKVGDDGRSIPLIWYGVFVVLQKVLPWLYRWAVRNKHPWFWPFALHAIHGQRSADLVAQAGGSEILVRLLYDYAEHRRTDDTLVLAWADDQN